MADFKTILFEKKNHAAWITLNRPEVRNAQSTELRQEVVQALEMSRIDDDVFVIVITGAGDRAFSAGADITEFLTRYPADWVKMRGARTHYELIREIPKPVIAMVNGLALGGGCEITLACDLVVAAETAQFGQPEINIGIIPGGGGTQVLTRMIGEKRAKDLVLTGRLITAQEALQMGMINQVVPKDKLREATEKLIETLVKKSPMTLRIAKMSLNKALDTPLGVGLAYERDLLALCFGTEDQKEGARAFLEKREPKYKGR